MNKIDRIGFIISITCAIHCAIMPILLIFFPYFLLSLFLTEKLEIYILLSSLILSITSVCFGLKQHKNIKILLIFSVGLISILIGRFIYHNHEHTSVNFFMVLGGLFLSASHWINSLLCKTCKKCNSNEEN